MKTAFFYSKYDKHDEVPINHCYIYQNVRIKV
jgi:hypothetical protein